MGALLDVPKTDKKSESGSGLDLRFGLSSMQGWRIEMEDAHCAKIGLPLGLDDWSFFAVFDGHAGQKASEYCAFNLLDTILHEKYFLDYEEESKNKQNDTKDNNKAIADANAASSGDVEKQATEILTKNDQDNSNERVTEQKEGESDSSLATLPPKLEKLLDDNQKDETTNIDSSSKPINEEELQSEENNAKIGEAIRAGFLALDEKLRAYDAEDKSGTTAVCTLISPTHLFFANCGDSRALISRGGQLLFSTEDHKPINPVERDRINKAGGTVMIQRVNGSLAVSRALGDFDYKRNIDRGPCEQLVSPEPEVCVKKRSPDDEFLVLACDGIWDVMTNIDICDLVRYLLTVEDDLVAICSNIMDVCLFRSSRDNMSIIIVTFPQCPKVTDEAKALDKEFEDWMKYAGECYFEEFQPDDNDKQNILLELIEFINEFDTHTHGKPKIPIVNTKLLVEYKLGLCKAMVDAFVNERYSKRT